MNKYIEIYNYIKNKITTSQLNSGDRLPSVRKATEIFGVSKTTVLNAYFALQADGYVIATANSGYYVCEISSKSKDIVATYDSKAENNIRFDLKSGNAEEESFDIKLWQRYIKNALRQNQRLLSYSEVEGEADLRCALCEYIREKRNIIASPNQIIIGAGVQNLLYILCSLLREKNTVSFPDESFSKGINLFNEYGYNVKTRFKDADIIYVSPSHMTNYGDVMPIKRRIELINYSKNKGSLIIEDDYDNDFLYQTKPTPSLYALSKTDNVVYMGSFSNVLVPGIRISFMVLTQNLLNIFKKNRNKFSQMASKTEQIALCGYIRDGHIQSQTRKVRRLYTAKAKLFLELINTKIPYATAKISENGLQVLLKTKYNKSVDEFEKNGISVNIKSYTNGIIQLILTPSAVAQNELENAVAELEKILRN